MKLTRRQLRSLIETTIKPTIPNVPSEELLSKIDNFARDEEMQPDADSFAGSFGYPEDRSYVEDLATYDTAGRVTFDTVSIGDEGAVDSYETIRVPVPYELVDNLIEADETVSGLKKSGEFSGSNAADSAWSLRSAVMTVYRYVNNYLDDKYGTKPYDYAFVRALGEEGASGYRADEYERAMQQGGEYI